MTASIPTFTRYRYSGPVQSVELKTDIDGEKVSFFEETLIPGQDYLLPEGHSVIEGWKAMGLIQEKPATDGEAQ
ncbi:MAG: hypothetical protein N4A65_00995 [Cohaesibacter sp.]|jgi:hypothetical protein|nr:hypothetical protein [Cohaesibacter sp.]